MIRLLSLAVLGLALVAAPASAAGISGSYIEARTCDVWTGPCFANAEVNLDGKHAVLGWKVEKGELDNVKLDGLGVVAVVAASDTLGLAQTGKSRAVLIVQGCRVCRVVPTVLVFSRSGLAKVRPLRSLHSCEHPPAALATFPFCPGAVQVKTINTKLCTCPITECLAEFDLEAD